MEKININIEAITVKTVAIVSFARQPLNTRIIFYQVTIDPNSKSGSGRFMRFGVGGDEITGWQDISELQIEEVLAVADENGDLRGVNPKNTWGVEVNG